MTTNQSPDTAILLERSEDYEICHGGQVYFGAKGGINLGRGGWWSQDSEEPLNRKRLPKVGQPGVLKNLEASQFPPHPTPRTEPSLCGGA